MRPSKDIVIALGLGKPGRKESEPEEAEPSESEDMSEDYTAMGQEVLDAIASKDPQAVGEAMRAFVQSCMAED